MNIIKFPRRTDAETYMELAKSNADDRQWVVTHNGKLIYTAKNKRDLFEYFQEKFSQADDPMSVLRWLY